MAACYRVRASALAGAAGSITYHRRRNREALTCEQCISSVSCGADDASSRARGGVSGTGSPKSKSKFLRLALGSETAECMSAAEDVVVDILRPLKDVPALDLFRAAKAWAAAQEAASAEIDLSVYPEVALPKDCERWMRYCAAVNGAKKAAKAVVLPKVAVNNAWTPDGDGWWSTLKIKWEAFRHQKELASSLAAGEPSALAASDGFQLCRQSSGHVSRQSSSDDSETLLQPSPAHASESHRSRSGSPVAGRDCDHAAGEVKLKRSLSGDSDDWPFSLEFLEELLLLNSDHSESSSASQRGEQIKSAIVDKLVESFLAARRESLDLFPIKVGQRPSVAARGAAALIASGLSAEDAEVVVFNDSKKPPAGCQHVPGHMVVIDRKKGCVVVVLRNSSCLRDALLDLDARPGSLHLGGKEGRVHTGMYKAAHRLDEMLSEAVADALVELDAPPRVLLIGHSLGAGVASLLTALWHERRRFPGADLQCMAFACPQVLDAELAKAEQVRTTSFVLGNDCVPCLGLASATDLRGALLVMADPGAQRLPTKLAASEILAAADRGETAGLVDGYTSVREVVGCAQGRMFPTGRIVKLRPGETPREVDQLAVDEVVVTREMVRQHFPRHYLAAIREACA